MILIEFLLFIGKIVFYFVLFILTFLFIILCERKAKSLSVKEKINYNICVAYLLMSFLSILTGAYALIATEWNKTIIDFNYALMSGLLRVICCFYIYFYSLSLQILSNNNTFLLCFACWILGFSISVIYYIKIELFFLMHIIFFLSLVIVITIYFVRVWKEYSYINVNDEERKNVMKLFVFGIVEIVFFIINVFDMIFILIFFGFEYFDRKKIETELREIITYYIDKVLLLIDCSMYISFLLLFIYDKESLEKVNNF